MKLSKESLYVLAADAILVSHVLLVAFIVVGLVLIYIGKWLSWAWVRNYWFRLLHLAAITVVVLLSWVGAVCPLTTWETEMRELAGGQGYEGSFIEHWLQSILYYEAPAWVFIVAYTVFAGVVAASWFTVPPKRPDR
jgi:hypothetical protein